MKITLSKKELLALHPSKSYRLEWTLLSYLSTCYNNILIVDTGTRDGGSAVALSVNPTNKVKTYDIGIPTTGHIKELLRPNIEFFLQDCNTLDDGMFKDVSIVYLDISHNGTDEEVFLKKLNHGFKGILLMDDVDCAKRWPQLNSLWKSISKPKVLLPRDISAPRGTGVVFYGEDTIEVGN